MLLLIVLFETMLKQTGVHPCCQSYSKQSHILHTAAAQAAQFCFQISWKFLCKWCFHLKNKRMSLQELLGPSMGCLKLWMSPEQVPWPCPAGLGQTHRFDCSLGVKPIQGAGHLYSGHMTVFVQCQACFLVLNG